MIQFAIVGMGFIADKHIAAIQNAEGANLLAICDTNPERLLIDDENVLKYTDLDKMLTENPQIDVVNICVPSGLHATLTKAVAKHKKHIVTEKPMALNSSDALEMMEIAKDAGVKLSIVHPNRYRPAIMEVRELMDAGKFGKISHANATVRWNRGQAYYDQAPWRGTKQFDGGVLMNQAIHNLDLLLWFMGPVKSVQGMVATRFRDIETEDVATALIEFESGALGVVEAATTVYPQNLEESLSIFGETASVKVSGKNAVFIDTWDVEGYSPEEVEALKTKIQNDPWGKKGHDCIIEDMVAAINEDRDPEVGGLDGYNPVRLIEAIIESSETGKRITFS
ncbi:Predicted dehydrogenase [Psychrobacillus psychrotolerans]|uniref:Predicted dehydrogenase n=1 Tax=Psychrobacillus psychrotolerans TaxID=126156 RepID=A0A1I5Z9N3_9BACI|nr:Gfo/Idh/MocA family oxidoreductase [Psychrobacillus psychrotolerans]SFQ53098.1 Predicted dehydrogenase [Psychrobacillus psychrotolerans]